jgi:RNA polymerase subunit RPABC4/transcription elongation factor Spt4
LSLVPDFEERLFVDRSNKVMAQWPMVNEASGCENCHLLFKSPVNHRCPGCGSESVFDVAKVLNPKGSESPDSLDSDETQDRLTGSVPKPETTKGEAEEI